MQCRRCGKDLGDSMRCSFCGYENTEGNVREMTRTEKNFFNGVTIDAGSDNSRSSGDYSYRGRSYETRSTYINFTGSNFFTRMIGSFVRAVFNGNRLAQLAATLIFFAFTALMFFVALPILFIVLAIGLALLALAKISG
ncbi:MAG: hypothetical protein IJS69_05335 [Selenomonadaceae bacterium]|nr:hypothetical protein [Selenomonadaceae bacterium]